MMTTTIIGMILISFNVAEFDSFEITGMVPTHVARYFNSRIIQGRI